MEINRRVMGDGPAGVRLPAPRPSRPSAVGYALVGATPITALALSVLEVLPLHIGGPLLVGGGIVLGMALRVSAPIDRMVLHGLAAGLIAVLLYDGTRLPFVLLGDWPDFIPRIGAWMTNRSDAHWSFGYLWRYLGNGAGMGLTFTMLVPYTDRWITRQRAGLAYGVAIWTGLVIILLLAPHGQARLFELTPLTIAVSLTGHLVYGGVLGAILGRETPTLWDDRPDAHRSIVGTIGDTPRQPHTL